MWTKLKKRLDNLGLKLYLEIIFFLVGVMVCVGIGVALYFFRGVSFLLAAPALMLVAFVVYFFSRYGAMERKRLDRLNREFVDVFTFFGIFVNDGFTVYNSLQRVEEYCSDALKDKIEGLLRGIDEDKSVQPFVDFALQFQNISVKEVMLAIYQMVDEGEGGAYIQQFQKLFGKLSDTRHELDARKRLERLDTLSFLPLAGAGIAMLSLTLSIMEIMGGLMDVL